MNWRQHRVTRAMFERIVRRSCLALGVVLVRLGLPSEFPLLSWQGETMGSVYTVKVVATNLGDSGCGVLREAVDNRLKEVNRQMSHYQSDSELSRFNRAPGREPFPISSGFARVLRTAQDISRQSAGAFDPTLGPLINLWGFGEESPPRRSPDKESLRSALARVGLRHLQITDQDSLVKDTPDLRLNLSGIAKGWGVDSMADVLRAHGHTNFYVSISGEVFASGHNARGTDWQVAISAPVDHWRPGDPTMAVISLSGQAVSTSGDYQKYFVDSQGRRQCHVLDPRTGSPVQHNLASVSVVADTCTFADALATTLFVLGPRAGPKFIGTFTNAAALFVIRESDGSFRSIPTSDFARLMERKAK
ncbi:MAG TPA: FAD:protein FMN transferase [Candidatus Paceibacterota bacterium]|nr:FAD:protein FMN transferase [Candidatus Paceibacterota bacterium]